MTLAMRNRSRGTLTEAFDQRWTAGAAIQIRVISTSKALPPIIFRLRLLFGASWTSCADVSAIFSCFPQVFTHDQHTLASLSV